MTQYTEIVEKEDVTEEVKEAVWGVIEGWYDSGNEKIDWEDVWDRVEGTTLSDGTTIDMGTDSNSPAMKTIKAWVRKIIREG